MVVQVAGKVRARLEVAADITEEAAVALALADAGVHSALGGAQPSRIVARLPKLVNFVP
jgi:leucyl-tRNA synthetase